MKKRKFLSVSLMTLVALGGLASCGEKGDKGDQGIPGIQGEQGEQGIPGKDGSVFLYGSEDPASTLGKDGDTYQNITTGDLFIKENGAWKKIYNSTGSQGLPGENGEPGKDGSKFLYGASDPEASVGKDGDIYQNTTTGDLFIKEAGAWKKIYNNKGQDGENGEAGTPGEDGEDAKTSWSNSYGLILNGKVSQDKGSYITGEKVTFKITPNTGCLLSRFTLNGELITLGSPKDNTYVYETSMIDNGFFVEAEFTALDPKGETVFIDGTKYEGVIKDGYGNIIKEGTKVENAPTFEAGSGTKEDPLVLSKEDDLSKALISGEKYFKVTTKELKSTGVTLPKDQELSLDLNDNKLVLNETTSVVDEGGVLEIKNGDINFSSTVSNRSALQTNKNATLKLDNVDIVTTGNGVLPQGNSALVEIKNSTIKSTIYGVSTNAASKDNAGVKVLIENSEIISNGESHDNTGVMLNHGSEMVIKDSIIGADRNTLIVRAGKVTLENVTLKNTNEFNSIEGNTGKYEGDEDTFKAGNEVPAGHLIVGNKDKGTAYDFGEISVTAKNVKFVDSKDEEVALLSEEIKHNQIFAVGKDETNKVSIYLDKETAKNVDLDRVQIKQNATLETEQETLVDLDFTDQDMVHDTLCSCLRYEDDPTTEENEKEQKHNKFMQKLHLEDGKMLLNNGLYQFEREFEENSKFELSIDLEVYEERFKAYDIVQGQNTYIDEAQKNTFAFNAGDKQTWKQIWGGIGKNSDNKMVIFDVATPSGNTIYENVKEIDTNKINFTYTFERWALDKYQTYLTITAGDVVIETRGGIGNVAPNSNAGPLKIYQNIYTGESEDPYCAITSWTFSKGTFIKG